MTLRSLLDAVLGNLAREPVAEDTPAGEVVMRLVARATCEARLQQAHDIYRAAMKRAVRVERANRREQADPSHEERFQAFLSPEAGLCTIAVQPQAPSSNLIEPRELRAKLSEIRVSGRKPFPSHSLEETIPEGLLFAEMRAWSGSRECQQLHANGLVYDVDDCV